MEDLRGLLADRSALPVFYESLPPLSQSSRTTKLAAEALARTLVGFSDIVDAICVPQVEDERSSGLIIHRAPKADAIEYVRHYLEIARLGAPRSAMIAQPLTAFTGAEIDALLQRIVGTGIAALAVVGPPTAAKSKVAPTSTLAAIARASDGGHLVIGAIAVHARLGEPERMVAKVKAGASFFVSQIFYDAPSMRELICNYALACERAGMPPARLIFSLAPIISKATARLMAKIINPGQRLGEPAAGIPELAIGAETVNFLASLLGETVAAGRAVGVPLGISIGHVTERNVRLSLELAATIGKIG